MRLKLDRATAYTRPSVLMLSLLTVTSLILASPQWIKVQEFTTTNIHNPPAFAASVSHHDGWAAVGMPDSEILHSGGAKDGAAEIWLWDSTLQEWVLNDFFGPPTTTLSVSWENFGATVECDGRSILVADPDANYDAADGVNAEMGHASICEYNSSTGYWYVIQDFDLSDLNSSDVARFGASAGLEDELLLIGAPGHTGQNEPGKVFFYYESQVANQWVRVQEWPNPDGDVGEEFGAAVALTQPWAVVGAPGATVNGQSEAGQAFVYLYDSFLLSWGRWQTLSPPTVAQGDRFGYAADISGELLAVGSPYADHSGFQDAGAVDIYRSNGFSFQFETRLLPSSPVDNGRFGTSVSIMDDYVLIGSPGGHNSINPVPNGVAELFRYDNATTSWFFERQFINFSAVGAGSFGLDVSADDNLLLVGEPWHNLYEPLVHVYKPLQLTSSPFPLVGGWPGVLTGKNFLPEKKTWLVYSRVGRGSRPAPRLGVTLNLADPVQIIGTPTFTDKNGCVTWNLQFPDQMSGQGAWFQAVQNSTYTADPMLSHVLDMVIQ